MSRPNASDEHPFLLCTREQFGELRERANREPWASMRTDAIERVEAEYDGKQPVELQRFLGAVALAYVLEPDRRSALANRVLDGIVDQLAEVAFDPSEDHRGTVPPMAAAFVGILALDVVYDDLEPNAIDACEGVIESQLDRIDREGSWPAARYGTHGTWDVYLGERTEPDDAFYDTYRRQMTPDGVTTVANTYAFARLASIDDRVQKTAYADVLECTGIDSRYYDNQRFRRFYRWLMGSAIDPSRQIYQFGDSFPGRSISNAILLWRISRFDRQAAAYAAWALADYEPPGHILSYVLMDEPLPDPVVPESTLYPDGGAVFRERPDTPESLGAELYNITGNDEWHTHEETNAIAVSAYGAAVTVNGGWLGDGTRPPAKNNTLAINGERHEARTGAGLVEGFCTGSLDYACGDAGDALGAADFQRTLLLIHGGGDLPGYVSMVDEVTARPEDMIESYLHPATELPPEAVAARETYEAGIDHHAAVEGVSLTVHYGTAPDTVSREEVESGYLERTPESGHHYRLAASYPTDAAGRRSIATLLFPADEATQRPEITRIQGDGYSGSGIEHAIGVSDLLIAADPTQPVTHEGLRLHGHVGLCRIAESGPAQYFARQARAFRFDAFGFQSDAPVTIQMDTIGGIVRTDIATRMTIYHPHIRAIRRGGRMVAGTTPGADSVSFDVPAGQHDLRLYVDDA